MEQLGVRRGEMSDEVSKAEKKAGGERQSLHVVDRAV